ncbi:hypothetical protein PGT21_010830 [Puccinia graminis f. sp. tritici]|uniref:Uncharacterized protein n=1 Tax=Puccinia graminis f. sp. tritici TaxID=56615 RepID=A0A5B0RS36_PUCGR|nr:hypothetical protein PGT21_010830 [Puccinia graminis f. sp. tritici]KAA1128761.1 hypothetical protein PGTUg99_014001 [Puccinia graminis f. sp. tritici]
MTETQPKLAFQSQTGGHSNRLAPLPHEIIALMRRLDYHATQPKIHNVARGCRIPGAQYDRAVETERW